MDNVDGYLISSNELSGNDIQWNCEHRSRSGIVQLDSALHRDDPPKWVMRAMRCLTRWPFENHLISLPNTYVGFERDVYRNICHHFCQDSIPIIDDRYALCLLNIIDRCQSLNNGMMLDQISVTIPRSECEYNGH